MPPSRRAFLARLAFVAVPFWPAHRPAAGQATAGAVAGPVAMTHARAAQATPPGRRSNAIAFVVRAS